MQGNEIISLRNGGGYTGISNKQNQSTEMFVTSKL
jgi:hypothetical protein